MASLRLSAAVVCLTAMLAGQASPSWSQTSQSTSWTTYRNEAFDFAIDTPDPPEIAVTSTATAAGPMPTLQATLDLGAHGALQITALDVTQLNTSATADRMLEGGVQGALSAVGAAKDYETTITKGSAAGREFVGHDSQGDKFKGRIYYSKGYIVGVTAVSPAGGDTPAEWDRAERSLEFLR